LSLLRLPKVRLFFRIQHLPNTDINIYLLSSALGESDEGFDLGCDPGSDARGGEGEEGSCDEET
jgi:hypothetical protein